MDYKNVVRVKQWIEKLQSQGKYSFALETLENELSDHSAIAIKRALNRLSRKIKVVSIHKGYYLIIPAQYMNRGILPPALFLDAFMKHLQRPYYLALLNAAAYHGAAHQQPQEFFVITTFPVLRTTLKKGIKLNYISINKIPQPLIEQRNTEAGYLNVSNPALTATDLIVFEKRIGGLNRAGTVLAELAEVLKPEDFNTHLLSHVSTRTLQRLGFLLEHICKNDLLANTVYHQLNKPNTKIFRIPLKASGPVKGFSSNNRWKVIVNTEIEVDE